MVAAAALASAASAEEQWAPSGAGAAAAAVSASGPAAASEYPYHYPSAPAAPTARPRQSSDPAGILAGASMFRSMRESLADFSGRVGRGFSSAIGLNQEQFQSGDSSTRVRFSSF